MSVDNLDDTSDSPIQFGLAEKSLKVLQEHGRRLEAMVSAIKVTTGAGAGGQFSGKFLQVAEQSLIVQKDIAHGIRQLNIQLSKGAQLNRQISHMNNANVLQSLKANPKILAGIAALTGGGSGGGAGKYAQSNLSNVWDFMKELPTKIFSGIKKGFSMVSKVWEKTGGKLFKKTGQMGLNKLLGLGGVSIIGALVGKMISSSPLLQAMFKILNTSLTLIFRPIGDFFGAFFRPMMIYFLKEVAIPFFQAGRGWMKDGEKWGRIAVGFFIDPVQAIYSGTIKAMSELSGWFSGVMTGGLITNEWGRDPTTGKAHGALAEAELFQEDPAKWLRIREGLEEAPAFMVKDPAVQFEEDTLAQDEVAEDIEEINDKMQELLDKNPDMKKIYVWQVGELKRLMDTSMGDIPAKTYQDIYPWLQHDPLLQNLIDEKTVKEDEFTQIEKDKIDKSNWKWYDVPLGHEAAGDIMMRDWNNFWDSLPKSMSFPGIIPAFGDPGMEPGTTLDEINANMEYYNSQSEEQVEDTKDSFSRIAYDVEEIQKLIEDSAHYSKLMAKDTHGTMNSVELFNKQIHDQWGVTAEQMEEHGNSYINDLFELNLVFHQMKQRGADIALNDELRANAVILGNEIRLKEVDNMVDTSKHIGSALDAITNEIDTILVDFIGYQHMNQTIAKITFNELATSANTLLKLLGSKSSIKTDPNTPKSFDVTESANFGKSWLEKNTGSWESPGSSVGAVHSLVSNAGGADANTYAAGVLGPQLGGMNQFSYYLGPNGEFSKSGVGVPLTGEGAWKQIADYETAALVAEAYKNQSLAAIQNEIQKKISDGVKQLTGNQAAIYVQTGGGLAGLAAAELAGAEGAIPGINATGPGYGHWSVSQAGTALNKAISDSKKANPAAWNKAVGFNQNLGSGTGGGGGFGNSASNSRSDGGNPGAAARAAGYSTGKRRGSSKKQWGGIIDEPIFGVGLHSGREWNLGEGGHELVTPISQLGDGEGGGNIIIHIGNISKEADYMKLKPLIQRWILEASSRRGMV